MTPKANPFNQPVAWLAFFTISGLIAGVFGLVPPVTSLWVSGLCGFSALIFLFYTKHLHPLLLLFRFFLMLTAWAFLMTFWYQFRLEQSSLTLPESSVRMKGYFTSVDRKPGLSASSVFLAEKIWVDSAWTDAGFKVLLFSDSAITPWLREGIGFQIEATIRKAPAPDNAGEFNFQDYLQDNHIAGLIYTENLNWILPDPEASDWLAEQAGKVRFSIEKKIISSVPTLDAQAFVRGLLTGYRSWMPEESVQAYSVTGTLHILSVSGLHVGFVTLILFAPWVRLRYWFPRYGEVFRVVFTLLGLCFYGWLTGWSSSMIRAVMMSAIGLVSLVYQGKPGNWSSLFLAMILMCLFDPVQIRQPGFLLSFGAVGGLLMADRILPGTRIPRKLKPVLNPLRLTLFAVLSTAPVTVYYFQNLPLTGALANLIVIPATSFVMISGFFSVALSSLFPLAAELFGTSAAFSVMLMQTLTQWFAGLPFSGVTVSFQNDAVTAIGWVTGISLILYGVFQRKVFLLSGLLILPPVLVFTAGKSSEARVSFLSCGQGDLMMILTSENQLIMVDAGPVSKEKRRVSDLIRNRMKYWGKDQIDLVLITHPHLDHYGGLMTGNAVLPVKKILFGDTTHASGMFHSVIRKYRNSGTELGMANPKQVLSLGHEEKLYLFDPVNSTTSMNEKSFLIRYQFGDFSVLSAGDLEAPVEKVLVGQIPKEWFSCSVAKVSHHGSKTSSSEPWMEAVTAEWAVISSGRKNKYHLPVKEIRDRWVKDGSKVLDTQETGEIEILTNGSSFRVRKRNG